MIINDNSLSAENTPTVYRHQLQDNGMSEYITNESDLSFGVNDVLHALGMGDAPQIKGTGDLFRAIGLPQVADIQIKSIHDLPIIGGVMDLGSSVLGVNWEMNDSPFWRDWGVPIIGAVAGAVATILTGGLASVPILGITTLTVGGVVGTTVGGIAGALGKDQLVQYATRIQKEKVSDQITAYEGSLAQIRQAKTTQSATTQADQKALDDADKFLQDKLNSVRLGEFAKVVVPLGGAIAGGIALMS